MAEKEARRILKMLGIQKNTYNVDLGFKKVVYQFNFLKWNVEFARKMKTR